MALHCYKTSCDRHITIYVRSLSLLFKIVPETLQVATGLLIAEVNVNTMCELGSGGVSLVISSLIAIMIVLLELPFPTSKIKSTGLLLKIDNTCALGG